MFVSEPSAGYAELERGEPFDVVVASPSLPGITGGTFLEDVGARHPGVARLWFADSGTSPSPSPAARALPGTTRVESLYPLLERTLGLHRVVTNPAVTAMMGQLDSLPALPKSYWSLMKAANDPTTNVAALARIIESDPAMGVKVLQLVNSAYFGLRRRVTSIAQAVSFLGLELLKGLVLSAHVFSALDASTVGGFRAEQFQRYSFRVARLAKSFAGTGEVADEAFTAGILHDVGQLALAVKQPDRFSMLLAQCVETGRPQLELEEEFFGVGHPEIGAALLAAWGIPFSIVECVAWHHRPSAAGGGDMHVLASVHAASALAGIVTCGDPESSLDVEFLRRLGWGDRIAEWRAKVEEEAAQWANE
jgi:HD-like signal output (HDOD) protein